MSLPTLPVITYNLKDRGRKHRGVERNFNVKAICDSINGPACQERVKTRAMLGYFGHKPRVLFGLEPVEAGVIAGRYNEVEPAIVTTYLEAFPDGTIKHQTEFLDTEPGRKAARMYSSRVGGFSSAIDEKKPEFFGFDWVFDPNFSTNRPYTLDSIDGESSVLTLDQVVEEIRSEQEMMLQRLLDAKDNQIAMLTAALDSAHADNEQYLSILASKNVSATLDSTAIMPVSVSLDSTNRLKRDISAFKREAVLPGFRPDQKDTSIDSDYQDIVSRMVR